MERKEKFSPILTYEGDTELAYFEHLAQLIQSDENRCFNLSFLKKDKSRSPLILAQRTPMPYQVKWYHIIDKESDIETNRQAFLNVLSECKQVKKTKRNANLILGYSNVSFDAWILLHKMNSLPNVESQQEYWTHLQREFNLNNIQNYNQYKSAKNFQRVLKQITLQDISSAITKAYKIERANEENFNIQRHCGFEFFNENPAFSIHKVVEDILKEVKLL